VGTIKGGGADAADFDFFARMVITFLTKTQDGRSWDGCQLFVKKMAFGSQNAIFKPCSFHP
jgi:hypothetical protein